MNLLKEILKEHSKAQTFKITTWVGNDPLRFNELINLFLEGSYRVTQRAGWPISNLVIRHPEFIKPHLRKVLGILSKPGIHDAVKRNITRLLQFITIPKKFQGAVVDICLEYLANPKEAIAVRVFSMTVLTNLAMENPALKNEIVPLIEDQLPFAIAGFRSRAKRTLKQLKS